MSTTSNQGHFLRDLTVKLFSELSAQKSKYTFLKTLINQKANIYYAIDENFCISPLSISMAMSLAYSGARNKTAAQLKQFLNLNDLSNEEIFEINKNYLNNVIKLNKTGFKLFLVNKLYVKKGANLNPEFIDCLNSNYFTDPELIDFNLFETIIEMNDWIAVNTNNKVNNLIDYDVLNNYTKMLLANASYFKGKWLNQFNKDHTYFEDFYLNDGSTVKVEMMKLLNKKFLFKINPGGITAITCEIPYIGDSLVMTVILPHEGISLQQVESELTSDVLKQIMYFNKNMYIGKVNVYLPKFKIEYKNQVAKKIF